MKDTLRLIELLEGQIESFSETGIYEIERDLLLERLRGVYASVLALDVVTEEDRVIDALLGVVAGVAEGDESEPEMEVERIYPSDDEEATEEEPATNEVVAAEEEPAEEVEEEPAAEECVTTPEPTEEVVEEEVEEPAEQQIEEEPTEEEVAEEEPIQEPAQEPAPTEIDHHKAMSLYDDDDDDDEAEEELEEGEVLYVADDDDEPEEVEEEVAEEEEEPTEDDAEVAEEPQYDGFAEPQVVDVATAASASMSLRQSIGINDKFILLRDLFAGDNDYYESSIDKLDEFDNLDEAMLYIYDNFRWSPNSEGARLLMELLARKLF